MADNNSILSGIFDYAINEFLQPDETKESMLKKFNGDKIALLNFLRDRDYKVWIKSNKAPADTTDIQKKIDALIKQHQEDVADGRIRLYTDIGKKREEKEENELEVKSEEITQEPKSSPSPSVKYVEPDAGKKRTWKKSSKKTADKKSSGTGGGQSSLF